MMPFIAGICAVIAICLHFAGVDGAALPAFGVTVLFAITGLVAPGKETQTSGRIFAVLSIVGAATPFLVEAVGEFRYRQLERARAAATASLYVKLQEVQTQSDPIFKSYFATTGWYPEFDIEGRLLPRLTVEGQPAAAQPVAGFEMPMDPFSTGRKMRSAAVRGAGIMLVSAGQDGLAELPLPGPPLDFSSGNDLAPFAITGIDRRMATYDPTNGALGLGDVVLWSGQKPIDDVFKPLDEAWTLASQRSPILPIPAKGVTPTQRQSETDGSAAIKLFEEGNDLAALILASRAIPQRPPHTNQWGPGDFRASALKGIILYRFGHYRMACDALGDHFDKSPNDPEAHFYAGAAFFLCLDIPRSRMHYAAAAQVDPASPYAASAEDSLVRMDRGEAPLLPPLAAPR